MHSIMCKVRMINDLRQPQFASGDACVHGVCTRLISRVANFSYRAA